jgi:hypothetical protein
MSKSLWEMESSPRSNIIYKYFKRLGRNIDRFYFRNRRKRRIKQSILIYKIRCLDIEIAREI